MGHCVDNHHSLQNNLVVVCGKGTNSDPHRVLTLWQEATGRRIFMAFATCAPPLEGDRQNKCVFFQLEESISLTQPRLCLKALDAVLQPFLDNLQERCLCGFLLTRCCVLCNRFLSINYFHIVSDMKIWWVSYMMGIIFFKSWLKQCLGFIMEICKQTTRQRWFICPTKPPV